MENSAIEIISKNIRTITEGVGFSEFLGFLTQLSLLLLLCFTIYYLIHIGNRYIDNKNRVNVGKKQIYLFILVFLMILTVIFMFRIRALLYEMLSPFIFAIIFAYILNPLVSKLQARGIQRVWGVLIVYFIIILMIIILSMTIIPRFVAEIKGLIQLMPKYSNNIYDYIYDLYLRYNRNLESLPSELEGVKELLRFNIDKLEDLIFNIFSSVTSIFTGIFSKIISLVLVPILAFYLLKDVDHFKRKMILLMPRFCRKEIVNIFKDIDFVLAGFIRGQLIVAAFVGILSTLALLILRVDFAILVGLIAGISNIIPYFGPIIGTIPGILFALMDEPIKALWVLLIFFIIQQIESAIIAPKIVGKSVGIHPVFVILALIIGGRFWGILGLLIAVPIAAILKVLAKHILHYVAKI